MNTIILSFTLILFLFQCEAAYSPEIRRMIQATSRAKNIDKNVCFDYIDVDWFINTQPGEFNGLNVRNIYDFFGMNSNEFNLTSAKFADEIKPWSLLPMIECRGRSPCLFVMHWNKRTRCWSNFFYRVVSPSVERSKLKMNENVLINDNYYYLIPTSDIVRPWFIQRYRTIDATFHSNSDNSFYRKLESIPFYEKNGFPQGDFYFERMKS